MTSVNGFHASGGSAPRPAAFAWLACLLALGPAALDGQETPAFPTRAELVVVDAVVLDTKGDPVAGLGRGDFEVEEDGEPVPIVTFDAVELPEASAVPPPSRTRIATNTPTVRREERRTFVIVFDDVHMAPERIGVARKAVDAFLRSGLRPGDEVTLVPTSGGAWWTAEMPEGSADLSAALERLEGLRRRNTSADRISDWEAMRLYLHRDKQVMSAVARRYYEHRLILEPPGGAERADLQLSPGLPLIQARSSEVYQAALARKRATLDALERVAQSLTPVKGRKSIILVSEGFTHEPQLLEFRDLARSARTANAAIYFLDARGLGGVPLTADAELAEGTDPRDLNAALSENVREAQGADSVAIDSGGFSVKNSNDLAAGLRRIARESSRYYLLAYEPRNRARDGKFHRIEVRVRRPGLEVRARRGYYAPKGDEPARREEGTLDPRLRQALDSPYATAGIPLRMTSYVLGGASGAGKATVLLVAEADPASFGFERRGDRFETVLESYALVSARDTGENAHREKLVELSLPAAVKEQLESSWMPIVREFDLGPGTYQSRLLLRDRRGGRIGTVRHDFTVPPLDGLRTSTAILTDTLQPAPAGSQIPGRPVPVARRRFAVGRTLYYLFEIYGAQRDGAVGAPRVSAGYAIHGSGGSVLAQQPAAPLAPGPRGELSQVFVFSLKGVAPGDYEVVLHVQDEVAGKTLEVRDPFTVAAPGSAAAPAAMR
jgi:VWFA-related protein